MGAVSRFLLVLSLLWNLCASGKQPAAILPDPKLTPGDVFDVTLQDICTPGYSRKVRDVPRSRRNQAYSLYGITSPNAGDYQLDHLISALPGRVQLDPEPLATIVQNIPLERACEGRAGAKAMQPRLCWKA